MCGIAGHLGFKTLNPNLYDSVLSSLSQRGPDQQKYLEILNQKKGDNINLTFLHFGKSESFVFHKYNVLFFLPHPFPFDH